MNAPMVRPTPRALITKALRDVGFQVLEGPVSRTSLGVNPQEQVYILGGGKDTPDTALRETGPVLEEIELEYVPIVRDAERELAFRNAIEGLPRVLEIATFKWGELSKYSGQQGNPRSFLPARVVVEV